ncbi:MAG: cupin domain-containing protein [Actinomycetota bacterium]|nr:cupin domain-containing protein [Actinomycetota bacterium]
MLGELVRYRVTAEQTGGTYSLLEVVGPQGGLPAHVQHEEDECIYVLEGEFGLLGGGKSVRAAAGSP